MIIPFCRHFEESEQDRDLKKQFAAPECQSAILNWLIEGCQKLKAEDLQPPQSVRAATDAYMQDSNRILQFVEEEMIEAPDREIKAGTSAWRSPRGLQKSSKRTSGSCSISGKNA